MGLLDYGYESYFGAADFDATVARVADAMQSEGFGILTEIDVKSTLEKKLGIGFRRYKIFGACNPRLAYEALDREPHIGLLLPCNIVVQESGDGRITVSIADPKAVFSVVDNPALSDIVEEVDRMLQRVVESLA